MSIVAGKEMHAVQYDESIEESQHYLRLALEQIGKHRLPTNPVNYSIWYEYATGKNKTLNERIDNNLGNSDAFKNGLSKKIYHECIAGKKEVLNDLIRNELQKVLGEVTSTIQTTNQQYTASESNLESINETLEPSLSGAEIEQVVNKVRHEVRILESTNASFRDQLNQATDEINQLKDKLEQYRKEAIKDPLTKIYNRRGFEQRLESAINKAYEDSSSLCLIIADIDHFKKINDTHGHLVGDNVIRMVAGTMRETVKGKDSVARIGGEEFAILLKPSVLDEAAQLAEILRQLINKTPIAFQDEDFFISASFGVAVGISDLDSLLKRADSAMYKAKEEGRNTVICDNEMPSPMSGGHLNEK